MQLPFILTYTLCSRYFDTPSNIFQSRLSPHYYLSSTKLQTCLRFEADAVLKLSPHLTFQIDSLYVKLLCCSSTYQQSFPDFCNHQTITSITAPLKDHTPSILECNFLPISMLLLVNLPIRKCPYVFTNVLVQVIIAHQSF
jgi:hypothetical protein